jgi:glycosyltransferase involved in cell wall biosynthesis
MTPFVAVCICTFERTDGLRTLLQAIDELRLSTLSGREILLIIVDNSSAGTAEGVFRDYSKHGRFRAQFVHEGRKGLSNARNAALHKALAARATYIAFIDDDEIPAPDWLESLVATALETRANAVVGPVIPIFEKPPPAWAVACGFYAKRPALGDGFVDDGYTANCLFSSAAIKTHNLRFDSRFNETGGEDTMFFRRLIEAQERIGWADGACVMEFVPERRMAKMWLLKRWYRTGAVEAAVGIIDSSSCKGKLFNALRGLARLGGGLVLVAMSLALRPFRRPGSVLARCYTVCRGAGMLMSVLGKEYAEYSIVNYRKASD